MQNGSNLFDYLTWRGDLSFEQSAFNEVDGLILSVCSYLQFTSGEDFRGKTLGYAVKATENVPLKDKMMIIHLVQESTLTFIDAAVASPRFKDLEILDYVNEYREDETEQFAATCFRLPDNSLFIAFRGTDDSLVGWKEDFQMAFVNGIPSQIAAAAYAQRIYDRYQLPLSFGGHSKGGNLAIWAAAHLSADDKNTVRAIYSYDGPGFLDEFLKSDKYKAIKGKISSYVPDSSLIGILMGHSRYQVIKSSSLLFLQHDPLSWQMIGTHFEYADERSQAGKLMETKVNRAINDLDKELVPELVEEIFNTASKTQAKTLDELKTQQLALLNLLPRLTYMVASKKIEQTVEEQRGKLIAAIDSAAIASKAKTGRTKQQRQKTETAKSEKTKPEKSKPQRGKVTEQQQPRLGTENA